MLVSCQIQLTTGGHFLPWTSEFEVDSSFWLKAQIKQQLAVNLGAWCVESKTSDAVVKHLAILAYLVRTTG